MRKLFVVMVCLMMVAGFSANVLAGEGGKFSDCTTLQDGVLTYSAGHYLEGQLMPEGFDEYGYNYQGHMFSGSYANAYLGRYGFPPYEGDDEAYLGANPGAASTWVWPYRHEELIMKWSDEWLSNKDCNGDGLLDRGYSCDSSNASNSACPGAWLTNHQRGYMGVDESNEEWPYDDCHYTYLVKIITPDTDAGDYKDGDTWYTADGTEIGPVIWGGFAIVQEVVNESCTDTHGAQFVSPASPGLGRYNNP